MVHKSRRDGRWFAQFVHERGLMHEIAAVRKMKAELRAMKNDMAELGVSQEAQTTHLAERLTELERLLRVIDTRYGQTSAKGALSSGGSGGNGAGSAADCDASNPTADRFVALEARFERVEIALNALVARK